MKRITLLLAALGVVSAAAYAAPELTVTKVGQELEMEHTNGTDDTVAWLWNSVGLKYDDWSFGLTAGKKWNYDNDDKADAKGVINDKGITSNNHRLQFDVSKPVTDNLTLKGRYRGEKNLDRFQVGYDYSYGMFLSSGDFWYDFYNDGGAQGHDELRTEWFPIGVKIGPVTAKYFVDYREDLGGREVGQRESYLEHQVRLYAPLYKADKFSLSTEARITLHAEEERVEGKKYEGYSTFEDFGCNRVYLKANYALSENLNVYANYFYEFKEREARDGYKKSLDNANTQNLVLGWSYSF